MSEAPTPPAVEGIVSKRSEYTVEETLGRLRTALAARGLAVFARVDHSDEAARIGLSMQPAHVLIFGNPRAGTPLMIASPLLALDLPLRALVWQDTNGSVWVSYHSPEYLTARYAVPSELAANITGVVGLIDGVLSPGP